MIQIKVRRLSRA